jgi:hypothetical protein
MAKIKTIIKLRSDSLSNWQLSNVKLVKGEAALALRTDNKYEIRIGTTDEGKTWGELENSNLTIPAANVDGLLNSLYQYQLVEDSVTSGKFKLQKKLQSEETWTDVENSTITLTFTDGTYSTTNPIALKSYVDTAVAGATTQYFEGVRLDKNETDEQAIARIVGDATVKGGSTLVIKTEINGINGYDSTKTVVEAWYNGGKFYESFDPSADAGSQYTEEITNPDATKYYLDLATGTKYYYTGTLFSEVKIAYEHIAFTYDTTTNPEDPQWRAMDGNYNATNVYFTNDFIATAKIGRYQTLTNGSVTIPAKGKNVYQVLDDIVSQENTNPTKSDPSVSVTASNFKAYEAGTTLSTDSLNWSASLSAGSYQFGPSTGITAKSWAVTTDGSTKTSYSVTTSSGKIDGFTVKDTEQIRIKAVATYDGSTVYANSNKGNPTTVKLAGGSKTNYSGYITGYRNTFYGILKSKPDLTSDVIRGLDYKTTAKLSNVSLQIKDALRVVIAIPKSNVSNGKATYNAYPGTISKILDSNDSNANLASNFTQTTVLVNDASGANPIEYNVFYKDFASKQDANTFVITQ